MEPVAISFATDGRMFVAEKRGVIRVYKNGTLLLMLFVDISAEVNNYFEHGRRTMLHPDLPAVPDATCSTPTTRRASRGCAAARVSRSSGSRPTRLQSELA